MTVLSPPNFQLSLTHALRDHYKYLIINSEPPGSICTSISDRMYTQLKIVAMARSKILSHCTPIFAGEAPRRHKFASDVAYGDHSLSLQFESTYTVLSVHFYVWWLVDEIYAIRCGAELARVKVAFAQKRGCGRRSLPQSAFMYYAVCTDSILHQPTLFSNARTAIICHPGGICM
jgi:hypothetical protein